MNHAKTKQFCVDLLIYQFKSSYEANYEAVGSWMEGLRFASEYFKTNDDDLHYIWETVTKELKEYFNNVNNDDDYNTLMQKIEEHRHLKNRLMFEIRSEKNCLVLDCMISLRDGLVDILEKSENMMERLIETQKNEHLNEDKNKHEIEMKHQLNSIVFTADEHTKRIIELAESLISSSEMEEDKKENEEGEEGDDEKEEEEGEEEKEEEEDDEEDE